MVIEKNCFLINIEPPLDHKKMLQKFVKNNLRTHQKHENDVMMMWILHRWYRLYIVPNSNTTALFQQLINNIIIVSTVKYKLRKTLFFTLQSLFHVIFFVVVVLFIQRPFFYLTIIFSSS